MLIGIDGSQANRKQRSGTEWYAFHLIAKFKKLLKDRIDVKVRIYLRNEPREDLAENLPSNFEFKILRWPISHFWVQKRLSLEMLFSPPDILFCPAHTIPIIHPKKTITTLHDIGFVDNPELYDWSSLVYHRFSAWLAVWAAKKVLTISEFSKARIISVYRCPPEKLFVTPLGFELEHYRQLPVAERETILKKYQLNDKEYFLFVGTLVPKKNIFRMLQAFDIYHNMYHGIYQLIFVGRKCEIGKVWEYLQGKPGLQKFVRFLDYVEAAELSALYRGAKLFLFPTLYEGFGLPILEAQASGTPVIASNVTASPEVAGNAAALVDPKDVKAIATAMTKICRDKTYVADLIARGKENVKNFSWNRTATLTLEQILKL